MFDLIIHNATLVLPNETKQADIALENGKITDIACEISSSSKEEINATGLYVFPGLIDVHVHFNEPGRKEWEGIQTGSSALAAGGWHALCRHAS